MPSGIVAPFSRLNKAVVKGLIAERESRMSISQDDLNNWFTYHPPTPDQLPKYLAIREAGLTLAKAIVDNTPSSADQTYTIRLIRMAIMTANASIACQGK
jgi:hypothetical protein